MNKVYFMKVSTVIQGNNVMLIQSDYHIHAAFYRIKKAGDIPGPTAAEQLTSARDAGSVYVGIVEHCNTAAKHPFSCLEELSQEYYSAGFDRSNVFLGVESDLAEDGSDHCGFEGRKVLKLHYVIGSVHLSPALCSDCRAYIDSEYKRITNALKHNDNIDIIGHPFGEGIRWERNELIPRWSWEMIPDSYLDDILHLAKESGKALEINRCNFEDSVYLDFLARLRDEKILFEVGSDAHNTAATVKAAERTKFLENMNFKEGQHWKISQ